MGYVTFEDDDNSTVQNKSFTFPVIDDNIALNSKEVFLSLKNIGSLQKKFPSEMKVIIIDDDGNY